MGLTDKIKKALNIDEGYFDEEDGELEYEPSQRESARAQASQERRQAPAPHGTKVVDIHTTAKLQVVLKTPDNFDDATANIAVET